MHKRVFKTIFKNSNINFPVAEGEKIPKTPEKYFSILLCYIFYKNAYCKEPTNPKLAELAEALLRNGFNFDSFDQATASRNLKNFRNNPPDVDFIVLKEWEKLLREDHDKLRDFIEGKLKKDDETTIYLINLLKEPVFYCNFIQDILAVRKEPVSNREFIFKINEMLNIDLEALQNFFKDFRIKNIAPEKEILEKKLFASFNLIPLQDNLNIRDILYHNWKPLKISCNGKEMVLKGDMEKDFYIMLENLTHRRNLLLIRGIEGSGKSFISAYLATGALKAGFSAGYIRVENSYDLGTLMYETGRFFEKGISEQSVLFIDGIDNLNLNKDDRFGKRNFHEFIESYLSVKNKYLIFTCNPETDFYKKILNQLLLEDFEVFHIEPYNGKARWIKTIMEEVIYSQSADKTTGSFRMYFDYLYRVTGLSCKRYGYDFEEIFEGLAEIAYCSVKGKPKITDFDTRFRSFLENQQIAGIDSYDLGAVVFRHQIFQTIFAGEYIFRYPEKVSELWKKNKYRNERWSLVFLYLSEKLDGAYDDYLRRNTGVLIAIIYHLGKMRRLDRCEQFISYASDPEQKARETDLITLERAKNLYSYEGDYINCLKTLSSIGDLHQPDIFYEYLILVTCCSVDLFYPETTLRIIGEYLKSREIKNDPRILGNMARSYLRNGNFEKALDVFREKERLHLKNGNYSEQLRDQADIILAEAFYQYHNREYSDFGRVYGQAMKLSEIYDKKSVQDEISYDGQKAFVLRNISYFLVFAPESEQLLPVLEAFISESKSDEKAPLGIIMVNLACYFHRQGNVDRCLKYLYQSLDFLDTYNIEKAFVWYSVRLLSGDEKAQAGYLRYKEKAELPIKYLPEHLKNRYNFKRKPHEAFRSSPCGTLRYSPITLGPGLAMEFKTYRGPGTPGSYTEEVAFFQKLESSDRLLNLLDLAVF